MESAADLKLVVRKYARFDADRNQWAEFNADSLVVSQGSHLLVSSSRSGIIFESFSLENAKKFLKALIKNDCMLFLYRSQNDTKKFKVQFPSVADAAKAVQLLGIFFTIKSQVGKGTAEEVQHAAARGNTQFMGGSQTQAFAGESQFFPARYGTGESQMVFGSGVGGAGASGAGGPMGLGESQDLSVVSRVAPLQPPAEPFATMTQAVRAGAASSTFNAGDRVRLFGRSELGTILELASDKTQGYYKIAVGDELVLVREADMRRVVSSDEAATAQRATQAMNATHGPALQEGKLPDGVVACDDWLLMALRKVTLPAAYQSSPDHPLLSQTLQALPLLLLDPSFLALVACVEDEVDRMAGLVAMQS